MACGNLHLPCIPKFLLCTGCRPAAGPWCGCLSENPGLRLTADLLNPDLHCSKVPRGLTCMFKFEKECRQDVQFTWVLTVDKNRIPPSPDLIDILVHRDSSRHSCAGCQRSHVAGRTHPWLCSQRPRFALCLWGLRHKFLKVRFFSSLGNLTLTCDGDEKQLMIMSP